NSVRSLQTLICGWNAIGKPGRSNRSMKPTPKAFASRRPITKQIKCVCNDTLPWLISFSFAPPFPSKAYGDHQPRRTLPTRRLFCGGVSRHLGAVARRRAPGEAGGRRGLRLSFHPARAAARSGGHGAVLRCVLRQFGPEARFSGQDRRTPAHPAA